MVVCARVRVRARARTHAHTDTHTRTCTLSLSRSLSLSLSLSHTHTHTHHTHTHGGQSALREVRSYNARTAAALGEAHAMNVSYAINNVPYGINTLTPPAQQQR